MAHNDNRDILKWKNLIDSIQLNEKSVDEPMAEGTWAVPETPEQVKKLTTLLKNPLDAETALDELYDVFGDDELFDDLEVMKRDEPETDVRHVVIRRLKDMNFIKEVREHNKPVKEEEVTVDNEGNIAGYLNYIDECIDMISPDNVSEMAYRIQNAVDDIRTRELGLKASLIRDKFNENDEEELLNKVAEWIYHNSSEPISEIEYLLKKSGAVGEYMDAVSEGKEKVKEEECSACDGSGWDKTVTSDEDDRGCDECNGTGEIEEESVNEGGVHELRVDQQTHIEAEHHDVVVSSNDMGIIVDIYDKEHENIDTNTYWNDDVMEESQRHRLAQEIISINSEKDSSTI
jgi:hypothetical protein